MPRHCSANSRSAGIPATVRRCAAWSATTPVALYHPLPYGRRTTPSKKDGGTLEGAQLLLARTGWRHDVSPVGAVTSVAIRPVRPSPPPQCHPGHCITIPDAVKACGDGTPPHQPPCLVRPHVNDTLESSRGRLSNEQPLHHPLEATPGRAQDTPWRPARSGICQDDRLLHGTVRHASARS
jgi:hypothetical protein